MTAHRLVLLRHAKSSWEGDLDDVDRPLNARGRRDADAAGRWLAQHQLVPDSLLCSPARRTLTLTSARIEPSSMLPSHEPT